MRCISWNHAYNTGYANEDRGWRYLFDLLEGDVLLLQETTVPDWIAERGHATFLKAWDSRLWGSAVFSPNPHQLVLSDAALRVLAVRTSLDGLGEVVLASFHAPIIDNRVIPTLRRAVEALLPFLEGARFIVGGDLNTARGAAEFWPDHGHAEFFAWIDELGWHDCHWRTHGREQTSLWSPGSRPLQADHVFVDPLTAHMVEEVRVIDDDVIREISDHGPLVVDLAVDSEDEPHDASMTE
jgi:endonuclease/exonuclease/phosphatase family metal-dependent hydrolase